MFGIAEAGPLSFFLLRMGLDDYIFAVVVSAITIALVLLCVCIPKNKVIAIAISIVTCIAIFVWFFLGFSVAGLRIT